MITPDTYADVLSVRYSLMLRSCLDVLRMGRSLRRKTHLSNYRWRHDQQTGWFYYIASLLLGSDHRLVAF